MISEEYNALLIIDVNTLLPVKTVEYRGWLSVTGWAHKDVLVVYNSYTRMYDAYDLGKLEKLGTSVEDGDGNGGFKLGKFVASNLGRSFIFPSLKLFYTFSYTKLPDMPSVQIIDLSKLPAQETLNMLATNNYASGHTYIPAKSEADCSKVYFTAFNSSDIHIYHDCPPYRPAEALPLNISKERLCRYHGLTLSQNGKYLMLYLQCYTEHHQLIRCLDVRRLSNLSKSIYEYCNENIYYAMALAEENLLYFSNTDGLYMVNMTYHENMEGAKLDKDI